jgi:hypothetical protein
VGFQCRDRAALEPDDGGPAGDGRRADTPTGPARHLEDSLGSRPTHQDKRGEQERDQEQASTRGWPRWTLRGVSAHGATPSGSSYTW